MERAFLPAVRILAPLAQAALLGAAVNLFEERGHDAEERDQQASDGEEERRGAPQGPIRGQHGLGVARNQRHHERDCREQQHHPGQDVEIARHTFSVDARGGGGLKLPSRRSLANESQSL